jgi:hypothetical protein
LKQLPLNPHQLKPTSLHDSRGGSVERSFGWLNRFRRLARDYERLPETVAGLHFVVLAIMYMLHRLSKVPNTRSSVDGISAGKRFRIEFFAIFNESSA